MRRPQSTSGIILEMLWDLRLLDASHRISSRSTELKQGLALSSLNRLLDAGASSKFALGRARINSALLSLTHLLPRILVGYGAVLELLAAEGYLLVVLLAVCPILLEVYAVAACTLDGLHG